MNNHQITRLLCGHPRTKRVFRGVYSADTVPTMGEQLTEPACYVINLDDSSGPGTHWVAAYVHPDDGGSEYFDSYGEPCTSRRICRLVGTDSVFNPLRLQSYFTTTCGQHCLFYILCKTYRLDMEDIVGLYPGSPYDNDVFVNDVVETVFGRKLELLHHKFIRKQISRALKREMILKYELLHEGALAPVQAHQNDAGWDLSTIEDIYIEPWENKQVRTGLRFEIPPGYYIQLAPRSGLSLHYKLMVMAGVIDRSYHGEIHVLLYNAGRDRIYLKKHSRIAQLLLVKIADTISLVETTLPSRDQSSREDKGFGMGSGLH